MMKYLIFISSAFLSLIFICSSVRAQYLEQDHNHIDRPNEIGFAIGAVYGFRESSVATEMQLHYIRMLPGKLHMLGFGAGFESVLDLQKQFSGLLMVTLRPFDIWWLSLGPGITYFGELDIYRYSTHVITGLEFNAGLFHLGPAVEYTISGDEQHLMFGLHIGVPF